MKILNKTVVTFIGTAFIGLLIGLYGIPALEHTGKKAPEPFQLKPHKTRTEMVVINNMLMPMYKEQFYYLGHYLTQQQEAGQINFYRYETPVSKQTVLFWPNPNAPETQPQTESSSPPGRE